MTVHQLQTSCPAELCSRRSELVVSYMLLNLVASTLQAASIWQLLP